MFHTPVPLAAGFAFIERYLTEQGVPLLAFCACELRSPAPFTDAGFIAFNRHYCGTLERWGIMTGDKNPVARSNVCPEIDKPAEPSFHAFCFAREVPGAAGSPSSSPAAARRRKAMRRTANAPSASAIPVRPAMREKGIFVLGRMEQRMAALGATWSETTAVQVYTVYDPHPFFQDEIARRGAARHGLTWHLARPPVQGLDYEMDCRSVPVERCISGLNSSGRLDNSQSFSVFPWRPSCDSLMTHMEASIWLSRRQISHSPMSESGAPIGGGF